MSDIPAISPDRSLDTVGLFCPVPIIRTAEAVKEMQVGEVLLVLGDDWGIEADMPAWCAMSGNELLGIVEDGGILKAYVRKTRG